MNFKTLNLEEKKSQIPQSLLFIPMKEKKNNTVSGCLMMLKQTCSSGEKRNLRSKI